MKRYRVTIEGIAPILFNRFTEEAQEKLDTGQTGGKMSVAERIAEAHTLIYRNESGHVCVPAPNLKKCIVEGAQRSNLKYGKKAAASFLRAILFIEPRDVPFVPERDEADRIHETTGRRPPGKGGRCVIRRPCLNEGWQLSFTIVKVDDAFPGETIRIALESAGLLVGLGDWRPDYGRFLLTEWVDIND